MRVRGAWEWLHLQPRSWIVLVLATFALACGSPTPFKGTSPPADIPIPISNLVTVSGPDANGNVRVTGAPGAVLGGSFVRITNLGSGAAAFRWQDWLLASAWAQSGVVEIGAGADGSFQVSLGAKIGDTLRLVQVVDGQESPPLDLIVTGKSVALAIAPKALGIQSAAGEAFITGALGTEGQVLRLDLTSLPGSFPEVLVSLPAFSGISGLALTSDLQLGFVISPGDGGLYRLTLDGSEPPTLTAVTLPQSLGVSDDDDKLAISSGVESPAVLIEEVATGQVLCSLDLDDPNHPELKVLQSPLLALTPESPGPNLSFVVLTQFSDLSWVLRKMRVQTDICIAKDLVLVPVAGLTQPGDLRVDGQGAVAWLSDTGADQVLRIDLVTGQVQSVATGKAPLGLDLWEAKAMLWVVNQGDNSLTGVHTLDFTTETRTGVGLAPSRISLDTDHARALVLSTLDQSVVLVDLGP